MPSQQPSIAVLVRPAMAADAKAVRMLLPTMPDPAAVVVAQDRATELTIGAAAATNSVRPEPISGPGVAVEVIPPRRNAGIAGALMCGLERWARTTGAQALYASQRVELHSDAMHGWSRLGFSICESVQEHVLPLAQFEPRLGPLIDRFRGQGRIPQDAKLIPLYRANAANVLRLHLDNLGGHRGTIYERIRGIGPDAFHPRYSRVLVLGDKVVGCILAHRLDKDTAAVDANIVDPSLRGGWANVWLKLEATRGALSLGIKNFKFTTFDHYADTRRFLERMGGTTTRTTVLMMRRIQDATVNAASEIS